MIKTRHSPSLSHSLAPAPDRSVTILGATGSVGAATLALIAESRAQHGDDAFPVKALTAHTNWQDLAHAARAFRADVAIIGDAGHLPALQDALAGTGIEVAGGADAICEAGARDADWVMAAIVGAAGLPPVMAAAQRGAALALANKEALVCAGEAVMAALSQSGGVCLPVDSEHNAIFQVLNGPATDDVASLILTASGGPFRDWTLADMGRATPGQACAHPNWSMGAKISVDSATMMNKGLELIEARHIFGVSPDQLRVVVHPQSVVHSLVEFVDGSVLAQLGAPDMRIPIAHTLAWPDRLAFDAPRLDLVDMGQLTFSAPDAARFPALDLAKFALNLGDRASLTLNGANEIAVARFLDQRIGFLDISHLVAECLEFADNNRWLSPGPLGLDEMTELDATIRQHAVSVADRLAAHASG